MRADFLYGAVPRERVLENEPMARHTSFRIGGPADVFVDARSVGELTGAVQRLRRRGIPFLVVGRGSNLLVADAGYRGAIVCCGMDEIRFLGDGRVAADAGCGLKALYGKAVENGLVGLEFASGIPGTLGGAVCMNAGAYGQEMRGVVESVRVLDGSGQVLEIAAGDMGFGYRTSVVPARGLVVLEATLRLQKGDVEESRRRAAVLAEARRTRQPLDLPSAGSTFKRPLGGFAGTLIQSCGLKGARVGGAEVSRKHAGFIVNTGGATASDVRSLIGQVRRAVQMMTGVRLEPEIRFVGDFDA